MNKKLLLLWVLMASVATQVFSQTIIKTIKHGGLTRDYRIYIPKAYKSSKPAPLVFNFHGFSSNDQQQEFYGDFRPIADTAGFIIVHPKGTESTPGGALFFNVGFFPSTIDDIGFTAALIDTISAAYNINKNKIYATGMSNGGFMSYELACTSTYKFAAIASVTGSITATNFAKCKPSQPIPVMEIHGTADQTVPYEGNASFLPIDSVVAYWVKFNGCNPKPTITNVPDISMNDGATAIQYVYSGGKKGTTVEHFKVINGAHTWPGAIIPIGTTCMDFFASKEIWRFFRKYSSTLATDDVPNTLDFSISPNPTNDFIRISFSDSEKINLELIDLQGRSLLKKTIFSNDAIEVSSFAKGIYIAKISSEKGQGFQKFIKE